MVFDHFKSQTQHSEKNASVFDYVNGNLCFFWKVLWVVLIILKFNALEKQREP